MEMFLLPFWTLGSNETGATPSLPQLKSALFDLQFLILCYFLRKNYLLIWGALGILTSFNPSLLSIPSPFRRQTYESLSGEFSQKRETFML